MAIRGRRFGCLGALVLGLAAVVLVYALIAPWSFHMGGRWTPLATWWGVGRLQDSFGAQYGVYAYFFPYPRGTSRLGGALPHIGLRGEASVCTAGGAIYKFRLSGQSYGAWLDANGKEVRLSLAENTRTRPRRQFVLDGVWRGPELILDDQKSMFIHFRPGGALVPATSYTSPVPEKHAHITLSWGSYGDFERLCASLGYGRR